MGSKDPSDNSEDSFGGEDEFLLAKMNVGVDKQSKSKSRGPMEPEYTNFEVDEEDEKWARDEIKTQVKKTFSILEKKTILGRPH